MAVTKTENGYEKNIVYHIIDNAYVEETVSVNFVYSIKRENTICFWLRVDVLYPCTIFHYLPLSEGPL